MASVGMGLDKTGLKIGKAARGFCQAPYHAWAEDGESVVSIIIKEVTI